MSDASHAKALITGTQRNFLQERVVYGRPAAEVIAEEAEALGKRRVFIVTNRSLSGDNSLPRQIGKALGECFAGLYPGVTAHTPRQCVQRECGTISVSLLALF